MFSFRSLWVSVPLLLLLAVMSGEANAAKAKRPAQLKARLTEHIPGRYALLIFSGASPSTALNEESILEQAASFFAEAGVSQMDFVVYDRGNSKGDGVRLFATMLPETDPCPYLLAEDIEQAKALESLSGYAANPLELLRLYLEDQEKADALFNGKLVSIVLSNFTVEKRQKETALILTDPESQAILEARLAAKDPLLPIPQGNSNAVVRGRCKGLEQGQLIIRGALVSSY